MALFQAALGMESPGLGPAKVERKIRGRKALHMRGGASSDLADLHLGLPADCADESSEGPKPIENRFSYTRGGSAVEGYRHTNCDVLRADTHDLLCGRLLLGCYDAGTRAVQHLS